MQGREYTKIITTKYVILLPYGFISFVDINECNQAPHLCSLGRCENTEGSFLCICQAGFMASEDGTDCVGNN